MSLDIKACLARYRERFTYDPYAVEKRFEGHREGRKWLSEARSVNRLLGVSGPVWQEESFDHVIRGDVSLEEKIDYIRQDPVRRGLVSRPEEYRWLWCESGGGSI